jgi:hypothetical protein
VTGLRNRRKHRVVVIESNRALPGCAPRTDNLPASLPKTLGEVTRRIAHSENQHRASHRASIDTAASHVKLIAKRQACCKEELWPKSACNLKHCAAMLSLLFRTHF